MSGDRHARGGCTGVILAGGEARRFGGTRKGLERVGGERIIDRVAGALREAADDLLLVANDPTAATWLPGVRCERDVRAGHASLGGIHAALVHADGPVLVVAWDMPFVPGALLCDLRAVGEDADAAVPESDSPHGVEPLCGYYALSCVAPIERRLDAGELGVTALLREVRTVRVPLARVRENGEPRRLFMNVNTVDDLERARAACLACDPSLLRRSS